MGFFSSSKQENIIEEPKRIVSKKLYCIDFENTQDSGIIGISKLGENDEVIIFYGSNNNSISFVSHEMIVLAKCKVTIYKCDKSAKNYLDFQLVSYLGKRIGTEKFEKVVIVSKDMGYDAVVDFWTKEDINICRQEAIDETIISEHPTITTNNKPAKKKKKVENKKANIPDKPVEKQPVEKEKKPAEQKQQKKEVQSFPEEFKKKVRNAVKDAELKPTQYTTIYNSIMRSKTPEDYTKTINRRFGDKAESVLNLTMKVYEDYRKR